MFHPETYQAKRNSLNEIMLQQLVTFMRSVMPAEGKRVIDNMFDQYARGQDALKSAEADRVLGPVVKEEGVVYVDRPMIFEYMKANIGRTYFGFDEVTSAPDGSIGTAGFGTKFKDWLASLPDFDESISPDMVTGFYRDSNTLSGAQHGNQSLPVLVLRKDNQLIASVYNNYLSPVVLNLDHVPTDFPWHLKSKSALRSEMYAYRGDLKEAELVELLGAALASAGITAEVQVPVLPEVTNGLSQVEDAVELTNDAEAILADAEAPVADGFDTELDAIRNETDADKKKALYDAMSRRTDEAFRENPTEETYNNMLRVSAAFNGPGDAFAWNDMSDEDKTRLLARVIKRVAESN